MNYLEESRGELKRADHLIYVSLKYTRTCDIMKNIIHRLINSFEFTILAVLEKGKKDGKIKSIPRSVEDKVSSVSKLKRNIKEYLQLYLSLKKIDKYKFSRREEYRKGVTLICHCPKENVETTVPDLLEYFEKTKEFVYLMEEWLL
jgi:hypothetical protein